MTQVEDQTSQAEERSQETRSFVRQVRAATRRKYTPEEKIRIVLEGVQTLRLPLMTCADGKESNPTPTTPGRRGLWKLGRRG